MIRRMVGAILDVERGRITRNDIKSALSSNQKYDFSLSSPRPLVLMDVSYDFKFEIHKANLKNLHERISKKLNIIDIETQIYKQMKETLE
jgi:tRNA U38,U39,U40 pseudouridine synthase TruA